MLSTYSALLALLGRLRAAPVDEAGLLRTVADADAYLSKIED
ncbi:MAG TPA: hypothetical protein VNL77_13155 [Roseiflexaceae bacterium]|nr:hypothetical protein [Roseiflexaceae bacterium]